MGLIAIVHIPDHTTVGDVIDQQHTLEQIYGSRLVGVFDYPTRKEMTCGDNCTVKNSGAWRRDRGGFMKCSVCGSRSRRTRQRVLNALFDFLGANIYPKAPAAFRTPEGYGVSPGND